MRKATFFAWWNETPSSSTTGASFQLFTCSRTSWFQQHKVLTDFEQRLSTEVDQANRSTTGNSRIPGAFSS